MAFNHPKNKFGLKISLETYKNEDQCTPHKIPRYQNKIGALDKVHYARKI